MATKKRAKRKVTKLTNVLVRGTTKNPVPIIASRKKGALDRLARVLRGHFPGKKIRVMRVKI